MRTETRGGTAATYSDQGLTSGCPECLDGYVQASCGDCRGSGCDTCSGDGFLVAECDACGGTGRIGQEPAAAKGRSAAVEMADAVDLARKASELVASFESAQTVADQVKVEREKADRERAKTGKASVDAQRPAATGAIPAAVIVNMVFDEVTHTRLFSLNPRDFDPISRWMFVAARHAPGSFTLAWALHAAVALFLWVPLSAAVRFVAPAPRRAWPGAVATFLTLAAVLLLNYCVFPNLPAPVSAPTSPVHRPGNARSWTVRVMATDEYGNTGIRVKAGQVVSLSASGRWSHVLFSTGRPYYGPDGCEYPSGAGFPCPSAQIGALICKIGGGPWELVGSRRTIRSSRTGPLRLILNDQFGSFSDNDGSVTVHVWVTR